MFFQTSGEGVRVIYQLQWKNIDDETDRMFLMQSGDIDAQEDGEAWVAECHRRLQAGEFDEFKPSAFANYEAYMCDETCPHFYRTVSE